MCARGVFLYINFFWFFQLDTEEYSNICVSRPKAPTARTENGRSVGRTVGRLARRSSGRWDGQTVGLRTAGWTVGRSDGRTVGRSDGWTDGWTVGRPDGSHLSRCNLSRQYHWTPICFPSFPLQGKQCIERGVSKAGYSRDCTVFIYKQGIAGIARSS